MYIFDTTKTSHTQTNKQQVTTYYSVQNWLAGWLWLCAILDKIKNEFFSKLTKKTTYIHIRYDNSNNRNQERKKSKEAGEREQNNSSSNVMMPNVAKQNEIKQSTKEL